MPPPTLRKGSATPAEIYISVGVALSWWEGADDVLMGLFGWLCSKAEPTAFETYVASSRSARGKMLLSALGRYERRFLETELVEIRAAMKALDRLAQMRNQIAHGHVSSTKRIEDDVVIMEGNFLLPSLNEAGHQVMRDFRYAHTAQEIDVWRDRVRAERAKIMDAHHAAVMRAQNARLALAREDLMALSVIEAINDGRIPVSDYVLSPKRSGAEDPS